VAKSKLVAKHAVDNVVSDVREEGSNIQIDYAWLAQVLRCIGSRRSSTYSAVGACLKPNVIQDVVLDVPLELLELIVGDVQQSRLCLLLAHQRNRLVVIPYLKGNLA
jgi:hypothetical protein